MKNIFKKTMTVLGSVALIGATAGFASAASYPMPFDSGAVVITGEESPASDGIAAANIVTGLKASAAAMTTPTTTTLSGEGDIFQFEKASTKFHVGDTITGVFSSALDDDELPELLAEGTYEDNDNDEFDYKQSITMNALRLTMFSDSDYEDEFPTLGFKIADNTNILNYTLDFTSQPLIDDMPDSDLTLMGKSYYVLAATNTTMTLLDSASEVGLAEGETKTVTSGSETYEVSIDYIGSSEVSLKVNGQITNSLAEGQTQKLKDSSYVGIKDLRYVSKDTGISSVIFSIGKGKMILTNGQEVEINDEEVDNLYARIGNTSVGKLDTLAFQWDADDDLFVTEDSEITMPAFEAVKLSYAGLGHGDDDLIEETISIKAGSDNFISLDLPIQDDDVSIDFLYTNNTNFLYIGKDSTHQLATSGNSTLTFDGDEDEYFVATFDDGNDVESYLMKATGFSDSDDVNKTTFEYSSNGGWDKAKEDAEVGPCDYGSVSFTVNSIDVNGKRVIITADTNTYFDRIYSKEGMKIILPHETPGALGYINFTTLPTEWTLQFAEEDRSEDPASGDKFNATINLNTQSVKEVHVGNVVGADEIFVEEEDSDIFRSFMYSALGTELRWDKHANQYALDVIYHGKEVEAKVYITAASVGLSSETETGIMTAKDTETSMYAGKNIIVVGGSAINTVAADLLGGAYHGDEFTKMTGVSAGGFLIQSFDKGGKIALLVAGYNAADTQKAADYLVNNGENVDTTVGNKYTGTTATEATLVVE